MTRYYNHEKGQCFFKAIMWLNGKWCAWDRKIIPDVDSYIEDTRNDFYVPCVRYYVDKYTNEE